MPADRVNNVVGVDLDSPATGVYTAAVTGYNVPQGPQPYALVAFAGQHEEHAKDDEHAGEQKKDDLFQGQDAEQVGAEVLATACPYCITNFEESRLNLEFEDTLEIKDVTEIVREAI